MMSHDDLDKNLAPNVAYYANLQSEILSLVVSKLQDSNISNYDKNNILKWQISALSGSQELANEVSKIASNGNKQSIKDFLSNFGGSGQQAITDIDKQLQSLTKTSVPVSDDVQDIIQTTANQAKTRLNNVVNESLITNNVQNNTAVQVYRNIVTKATLEVTTGLKTPERALFDTIYKWTDSGLPVRLQDVSGRNWTLETYSRLVIQNTAHKTFNDVRLQRMNDYGMGQAYMSSHASARQACAPIQGSVVNVVEPGSDNFNPKYDSIYNHGYGTAGGTQGANCHHTLTPFDPEVNTEPEEDVPTVEQAQKNADIQAKQRAYERAIRQYKKQLATAQQLGDDQTVSQMKTNIANNQAKLRGLVADNDFLQRDYSREKVAST